jgi:hypothetical protein
MDFIRHYDSIQRVTTVRERRNITGHTFKQNFREGIPEYEYCY